MFVLLRLLTESMLHLHDQCFYSCLWITPDLRCQKRLWILCFSTTSIKIWRSGTFFAFSPLHLSEPLRKQKVVVCDLWLVDFDPFCVFLCFKVRCFVFEKHRKFYLSLKIFLTSLRWNMASFRFQRWNCSYRASKSKGNTATDGRKRTGIENGIELSTPSVKRNAISVFFTCKNGTNIPTAFMKTFAFLSDFERHCNSSYGKRFMSEISNKRRFIYLFIVSMVT